jgi:toxin ParE1/3/4
MLALSPFVGKVRDELGAEIRSFLIGNDVLSYQPIENTIDIIRFLHGARDIDALFNP